MNSTVNQDGTAEAPAKQQSERDFSIDALRAGAIVCIVAGHWIVTGLSLKHGVLGVVSPLDYAPRLSPYTFVLQALALFFFAAGYGAHAADPDPRPREVPGRIITLVRSLLAPLLVLAVLWIVFGFTMFMLGMPLTNIPRVGSLLFSPLWFFAVYLVLTALQPVISALRRRIGWWLLAACVLLVVLGDLNVYAGPGWSLTVVTSLLGAWVIPYALGMWLREDDVTGRSRVRGWMLLVAGVAILTIGLTWGPYPVSMVGVTGAEHSNLNPPSLMTVGLGLAQIGVFLLVRSVVRWFERFRVARWIVDLLNRWAIPIYLLHQTALLIPVMISAASVPIPGLISNEFGPFWLVLRLYMFPVLAAILALLCWGLFGRAPIGGLACGR